MVLLVLFADGFAGASQITSQVVENLEIVVATVVEDAHLYVAIAFVGIIVEVLQLLLGVTIVVDVLVQLVAVVGQRATNVHRKRQTHVAVNLCTLRQRHLRHVREIDDQTVVAGNVFVGLLHKRAERQDVALELVVLLSGLMAGVGEVEDVFRLLRVEHQRILIGTVQHREQVFANVLLLLAHESRLAFQFGMMLRQLGTQDTESIVEVLLLQHGVALQRPAQKQYGDSDNFSHVANCWFLFAKIRISERNAKQKSKFLISFSFGKTQIHLVFRLLIRIFAIINT